MQTIARANRVHGDKVNGLIVDYIGVFRDLESALAIYAGADAEGAAPIQDKSKLVEQLRDAIDEVIAFCANLGVDLAQIDAASSLERIGLIDDATNSILTDDETKRAYLQGANNVLKLYKAILPDSSANAFVSICSLIYIITRKINSITASADISDVIKAVEDLLDQSIAPTGYLIEDPAYYETDQIVDLSQIDFDQLREQFRGRHKQIEIEKLKGAINRKLSELIRFNRTRMDYQEKFEQMIAEYNAASDVQQFFEQLIAFVDALNAEEQRTITEQLSQEELALFDHLIPTELDLTEADRDEVKNTVRQLLNSLREKLVLDWRKRQTSSAAVRQTIKEVLDAQLPRCYTPALYEQKCEVVYQHIYDSYFGEGKSIYSIPGRPVSQN
jgi:type I restriction enzyme R subunit